MQNPQYISSAIGRMPQHAAAELDPIIADSEIGVLRTRSVPNSLYINRGYIHRPRQLSSTSSPMTKTFVTAHFLGDRLADRLCMREFSHNITPPVFHRTHRPERRAGSGSGTVPGQKSRPPLILSAALVWISSSSSAAAISCSRR